MLLVPGQCRGGLESVQRGPGFCGAVLCWCQSLITPAQNPPQVRVAFVVALVMIINMGLDYTKTPHKAKPHLGHAKEVCFNKPQLLVDQTCAPSLLPFFR